MHLDDTDRDCDVIGGPATPDWHDLDCGEDTLDTLKCF